MMQVVSIIFHEPFTEVVINSEMSPRYINDNCWKIQSKSYMRLKSNKELSIKFYQPLAY